MRNEKYIGDALLQKTYTTDFLSKTRIKNNGTVPQYHVEGNHETIIPKEIFMQVQEELLQSIVMNAINEMILDKTCYMKMLQENIATVIRNDASASTDDIDAKLLELQKELLQKANNRDDYDSIAEEIFQLRELKARSETDSVIRDERLAQITELCDFLKGQPSEITMFDESLVRRLIQKVTVFDEKITIIFKSNISVDVEEYLNITQAPYRWILTSDRDLPLCYIFNR